MARHEVFLTGATRLLGSSRAGTQTLAWAVENRPKRLQVFELSQIKLAGGTQQWPMQAVARIEFAEPVEDTDSSRAE